MDAIRSCLAARTAAICGSSGGNRGIRRAWPRMRACEGGETSFVSRDVAVAAQAW